MVSRVRRIVEFIERQYVTGQGDVLENIEALFCEDVEYHTDAETLTRDDLVAMGRAVRDSPRVGRTLQASRFREEGTPCTGICPRCCPGSVRTAPTSRRRAISWRGSRTTTEFARCGRRTLCDDLRHSAAKRAGGLDGLGAAVFLTRGRCRCLSPRICYM